jgi:filamentous hemagglutinin family protein
LMGENSKIKHSLTWAFWLKKIAMMFFVVLAIEAIYANPTGGVVTAGDATISQTATTTQINQSSDKAIINWNSFNIGANEATHFQQPNANSITLNRINPDQGASQIFGQLTSNGRIVLVNQSGFFFGSGAYVNVGGLIASTAGITDQNFLAGKMIFDQVSTTHRGTIINQGTMIAANNGLIALIGANVSNEGVIQANSGHVILASGNKFTLDLGGDGLINFVVDEASTSSGLDQNGHVMTDGVKNTGSIIANGGKILLTARDASGVVDKAINMSGVAQARSVSQRNGEIIFSAGDDGVVEVSGALLDVSGKYASQTGGVIKVLGSEVILSNSSVLDASGTLGGGTILIGGNFHGAGPEQNALITLVDSSVTINANALTYGNGGKVAVWSDLYTQFHGNITAQGGVFSGDGGYVETSGKYLNVSNAVVNTLAVAGKTGTWLLDPTNIYIALNQSNATSAGMVGVDSSADIGTGGNPNTFSASGAVDDSLLTTGNLIAALAISNVIVTTSNGAGAGAGNITVVDPVTWTSTNSLSLVADNNIIINAGISGINGSLNLTAANTAQSITTGVAGTVDVANFNLIQGQWYQVGVLPSFNVSNNFQIESGTATPTNAEFLRAAGGDGTSGNPYQLTDVYGVQGMASADTSGNNLVTNSFILNNNIDATGTSNWNSGAGFVPIGTYAVAFFTGNFDGASHTINNLYINRGSEQDGVGLFGFVDNASSVIQNIGITNANVAGGGIVGILVGLMATGTIQNAFVTGAVSSFNTNSGNFGFGLGGLIGGNGIFNWGVFGTITDSYSGASVSELGPIGNSVGGLVGADFGPMNNVFSYGLVNGGVGAASGLVGYGGNVTNGYWDTETSGQLTDVSTAQGLSTAQLQQTLQTGFSTSTWGIIAGDGVLANGSYPYLKAFYASTPSVVSGFAVDSSTAGDTMQLARNGLLLTNNGITQGTANVGANGFYYFLQPNATISSGDTILAYLSGASTKGNVIGTAGSGGNLTSLTINGANNIDVGTTIDTNAYSNSSLSAALGSLNSTDILYSLSGNNLTLGNATNTAANLYIGSSGVTYTINGTIGTVLGGSTTAAFAGPANINTASVTTSNSLTFLNNITLGASVSLTGTGVNLGTNGAGNTIATNGYTLAMANSAPSQIYSVISGSGGLSTAGGSGSVTLNAANTYTGNTTVTGGALISNIANALPVGTNLTVSNYFDMNGFDQELASITSNGAFILNFGAQATLTINNSVLNNFNGYLNGNISLTKMGSGTLNLQNNNTGMTGTTTVNAGILQLSNSNALGANDASNIVINSGGELLLTGGSLNYLVSVSGTGVNNAGAIATTGSSANVLGRDVTLIGDTTLGITNSGDFLTIGTNHTIGGAYNLTLSGAGTFILKGFIGNATVAPASLTSNVAMIFDFSNKLLTDGNQTYNGAVTFLNTPVAFTTNNGGTITFANTIIDNGYNAVLFSGANTGTVSLQNASTQNWHITGSDTGTVVGILSGGGAFSFGGFGSVTGGSGTNIFTFDNNFATLSGTVNGGAGTGTIDLTAYSAPIQIQMGGQYSGALVDNTLAPIANYANVQTINGSAGSTLQTANKTNVIVISQQQPTGSGSGYVNDPFNFSNITHFVGQGYTTMTLPSSAIVNSINTFTYLGVTYYYSGISGFNSNVPTPTPTPTPVPTPSVVPVDVANVIAQFTQPYYKSQLTQAPDDTSSGSGSSISSSGPVLPGALFVIQNTTAFTAQAQVQLDPEPLKITTKGACAL